MANRPDFKLKYFNRLTEESAQVGAAWSNTNGSISIRLNPCIVLQASQDMVLTLFPADNPPKEKKPEPKKSEKTETTRSVTRNTGNKFFDDMPDDVPF